ncbi:MAG: CBS domain-containing protein [Halofilum sp. (in: g-proteobacteria)]
MEVKEAMTVSPDAAATGTTLLELAQRMRDEDIGSIPVGENDRLVGMVTDRDIVVRCVANQQDVASMTAGEIMTKNVSWCFDDIDLSEAAHMMEERRIRRLPVINRDKRLVGMLSVGDISRASTELAGEALREVSRVGD